VLDAEPSHREEIPKESWWPLFAAIATAFTLVGAIFFAWLFTIGIFVTGFILIGWFWPKKEDVIDDVRREHPEKLEEVTA